MGNVKSAQSWSGLVVCKDSTGALATPSVGPVGALYVNGVVNAASVTISGSNPYKWTVTLPALTAGDCVSMYITATIATIATASVVAEAVADTIRLSDGVTTNALASGTITAAAIATDAIDADALATDAVTEIWAATSRTLTQSAASVTAAVSGSTITVARGDTLSATITGLSANTGYVSIDFTVKTSPDDTDDQAIMRIRKNASGTGDGLQRLNGAALVSPVVAADGSITVNSATSLTITLAARATDDLSDADGLYYDIQYVMASSVLTATAGNCNITADITRAVA